MRKHLGWASAQLVLLLAACSGAPASAPAASPTTATCVNAGAAHHVYVVVQHLSGTSLQRCVGFGGDQLDGDGLMRQSGIEYQTQTFSGLGKAVCQVDNEPAQYSECFPKDKPFWASFVSTGGGPWKEAQTGYASTSLKDGDALGWQYRLQTGPPPPPPLPKR